jgi:hypothetical protein
MQVDFLIVEEDATDERRRNGKWLSIAMDGNAEWIAKIQEAIKNIKFSDYSAVK